MATSSSSANDAGFQRVFSGDSEDGREYRRWKQWCLNKMLTMDKLAEASRGAYIMTLLTGKALETCEHLEPEEYQKSGGDKLIWQLLDTRFPKQEVVDELAETLAEVFHLQAKDGETMKQWSARASELLDRCKRKTGVDFPDQARGWLLLNRAGLSNEQRAVVVSRARGDLKRESIAAALRSCYPDLQVKRKGVSLVEETLAVDLDEPLDLEREFEDVELLIADHQGQGDVLDAQDDTFPEDEVAEVLATSWKERRQELGRLQRSRQFQKANVKRAFWVEVAELKRNTSCHKCGQKGHWSRECRNQATKGAGKSTSKSSTPSSTTGAALVEHDAQLDFVASVSSEPTLMEKMRQRRQLLISSPGFGVLDSGCGRTIIGRSTLKAFEQLWRKHGVASPKPFPEVHQFKYGNGETEVSSESVCVPVTLAGKKGVIRAAIVQGSAPLLISRSALKSLRASLDFDQDTLHVFGDAQVPLQVNSAGQYIVDLMKEHVVKQATLSEPFEEVMISECSSQPTPRVRTLVGAKFYAAGDQ